MDIERKLRFVGSSLVITIPRDLARVLKFEEGDYATIKLEGDKIIIQKKIEGDIK